ncbi:MAG TPA: hypothetical protein VKK79_21740, partial [Candidatus Lokiarchaeia archaeon]|nr:hypothetical protein [Candidatus Lokiarchaeia archaeon]
MTSDSDSSNRLLIQNTAGQWEQETKSRKANLIELVLAQGLLQLVMWAVWFPNLLAGNNIGVDVAYGLLAILGIFVLLLSPFRHRDTLKGWGIGDARYVINRLRNGGTRTRVFFISIIAILIVVAIVAFELLFPKIFHFMGINESAAAAFQATPLGSVVVVVLAVVIALFLGIVVIRYDNFLNALKMAFVVIVILGIPLLLLALVVNPNVLSTIDPGNFAIGFAGYIFWGALQQLLFASYFGTRFRKAFS